MQLVRTSPQLQPAAQQQTSYNAAYAQAERELQNSYKQLEATAEAYNKTIDTYNSGSNGLQALLDPLIAEQAAAYNAAVRDYNRIGQKYQDAGVITGFGALEEFTPTKIEAKPVIAGSQQDVVVGNNLADQAADISAPGSTSRLRAAEIALGTVFGNAIANSGRVVIDAVKFAQTPANSTPDEQAALKTRRQDTISGLINTVLDVPKNPVTDGIADILTGKTDAQLRDDRYKYQDTLGKAMIAQGALLSNVLPPVGELLRDSGSEILVSRDYNYKGLINLDNGIEINRPSVFEMAALGGALGAFGALAGSGAVTGAAGLGRLFPKATAAAFEAGILETVSTGSVGGGAAGGGALGTTKAAETAAKTSLLGMSALGASFSDIDIGIGDILSQYPRRNRNDEERAPAGEQGVINDIINDILDEYPRRDENRNNNRYDYNNRNNQNSWNRSELDYGSGTLLGTSNRLGEDYAGRNRLQNNNRYRNEFDYVYEYAALTEVYPRSRRKSAWEEEEEESIIAEPRRKRKSRTNKFTEILRL